MKVHLMHPDRDLDLEQPLPANAEALIQDLELETLLNAMARGDDYLRELARKCLLLGLTEPEAIRYRQRILGDCLEQPAIVRQIAKTLSLTTTTVASLVASKVKSVVLSVSTTTVAAMTAVLQVSTGGGDLLHQDYLKNYYASVRLRKAHASDALNALAAAFAADDITDQEFAAAIAALYGDNPNG